MDLDELIYHKFLKIIKKFKEKEDPKLKNITIELEHISGRLTLLARALTGVEISIFPAKKEGGLKDIYFLLPTRFNRYSNINLNIKYYLFRVVYLATQYKLKLNLDIDDPKDTKFAYKKSEENSEIILKELFEEYPNIKKDYEELLAEEKLISEKEKIKVNYSYLFGKFMSASAGLKAEIDEELMKAQNKGKEIDEITTELESKPVEETETLAVDHKAKKEFVVNNNFEKVETADEFNGIWREFDGGDDLSEHEDALDSLDLKKTVRVDDPVHSIYKAEFAPGTNSIELKSSETGEKCLHYDEWDYKKQNYKKEHCRVFISHFKNKNKGYYSEIIKQKSKIINELKVLFARVNNELEKVHKATFGEEIDFDAYVETYPDFLMKRTPDEKLYISKSKKNNELSILILVDVSLSSDGYTGGKRVLDIQKESLICFGEVLNDYNIEFQIDIFNSKTRNKCFYKNVKKFDEDWNDTKDIIGSIEADSYTRIGPALRHAAEELENSSNRKKWVLILTDGKPNDYDKYEGKQGLEDVKKALQELENKGIHSFALAVESVSRYYLPMMFGHRNYNILPQAENLPLALGDFYRRILND